MGTKYYVVFVGRTTGIFTNWNDTSQSVKGFPHATHKSYRTREAAEHALQQHQRSSQENRLPRAEECEVRVYCDGACQPNPGEAGSGVAVYHHNKLSKLWYGHYQTQGTNNTAELMALQFAMKIATQAISNGKTVEICSDSTYALNSMRQWANGWQENGWKKHKGEEVQNRNIIQPMYESYLTIAAKVLLSHVKGHSGIEGNELADRMAVVAIARKQQRMQRYDDSLNIPTILSMPAG